jgi:hypothetical protein
MHRGISGSIIRTHRGSSGSIIRMHRGIVGVLYACTEAVAGVSHAYITLNTTRHLENDVHTNTSH